MFKRFGIPAKRFVSMLLVTVMLAPLLPTAALAAPYTPQAAQAYTFHAALESGSTDSERTMFFTEDYFSRPASDYNPSLASASLCLAMSAFGSNRVFKSDGGYDYTKANVNWIELFRDQLGFSDVRTNAYFTQVTQQNKVGCGMAWKNITVDDGNGNAEVIPLIAVGVRGSNYMSEWAGNVNVGTSGDHAGFQTAADIVISEVQDYIESIPSLDGQDVKIWISGFSRAAATSNLFTGYLDEAIESGDILATISASLTKDDLYCYTFETPAGTVKPHAVAHGDTYSNIFNIINPNDLVPKVAPVFSDAAFIRYGTDLSLPSSITAVNYVEYEAVMKAIYDQVTGGTPYIIDAFVGKRRELFGTYDDDVNYPQSAAEFCSRFVGDLASEAVRTRGNFVSNYQKPLATLMDFFCGSGERFGGKANQQKFIQYFPNGWHILRMIGELLLRTVKEYNKWPRYTVASTIAKIFRLARDSAGIKLDDAYIQEVADMLTTIIWEVVGDNPLDNLKELNYMLTFSGGVKNILQAHDPDVCLAWLMSMDRNYEPTTTRYQDCNNVLNCGEYRAITITGVMSARVERLNAAGNVVSNNLYTARPFGSRQLRLLLPVDAAYRLTINSPSDGGSYSFNYLVAEYSPSVNGNKRIFYYKNPLETYFTSTKYTALIPAYAAGSVGQVPNPIKFGIPEGSDLDYRLSKDGELSTRVTINKLLRDLRGNAGSGMMDMNITAQPINQGFAQLNNVMFEVTAEGESLNYQWYKSEDGGDNWSVIPSATEASYVVENVKKSMVGNQYICLVYDLMGNGSYSNAATLYLTPVTGDGASPLLWGLLMLLACGGCVMMVYGVRKRRARS